MGPWTVLALMLGGCTGDSPASLSLTLRTDFVSGVEFATVHTQVSKDGSDVFMRDRSAYLGEDWVTGFQAAEIDLPGHGTYEVAVELLGTGAHAIYARRTVVDVDGGATLTISLTRDCRDVECPAAGTDPAASECFEGRCVDPRCSSAAPGRCGGAACGGDGDCPRASAACAAPRCVEGACLLVGDESCGSGEWCKPEEGCALLPSGG